MSPAAPAAQDGGWGWAVVASSFTALLLGYGSPQSVGVLYPEWLLAFGEGKARTAWVGSLVVGVGLVLGPLCSVCVVNFGARPTAIFSGVMVSGGLMLSAFAPSVAFLIFSYGVVVGMGVGLLYAATLTITCAYFDKKRGLALGIVTTGTSVGSFLYAALQHQLIQLFGLAGCLLIVGALALNILPCAGAMRPLTPPTYYLRQRAAMLQQMMEQEVTASNHSPSTKDAVITMETKEVQWRSFFSCSASFKMMKDSMRRYTQCLSSMLTLLRDRLFLASCISLFLFSFGSFPPQIFLEDLAQSSGLMTDVGAIVSLVSLVSIGAGVGKLGLGVMADVPRVDSVLLYALTVGVSGLGVLLLPFASSYQDLQVLSVILGFMSGNWTLTPYVTSRVVGVERLAEAHGILMLFGGLGLMLGPPVVGSFYDVVQSYDVAFYLSGSVTMAGSLILFVTALLPHPTAPRPPTTGEAELVVCAVTMATDRSTPVH